MTLSEFRKLDEEDRYILWLSAAVQVSKIDTRQCLFVLYQLDEFYIEMKFHKTSLMPPVMRTFSKQRRVMHYLDAININALISD